MPVGNNLNNHIERYAMKRTHYRNGDEITLACGCDSCSPSTIQGILCHEPSCKDAWRDYKEECDECGSNFWPEDKGQATCESCRNPEPYIGQCDECGDKARHSDPDQEVCDSCLLTITQTGQVRHSWLNNIRNNRSKSSVSHSLLQPTNPQETRQ